MVSAKKLPSSSVTYAAQHTAKEVNGMKNAACKKAEEAYLEIIDGNKSKE